MQDYQLVIFPNISELGTFTSKADESQMYTFKDKGDRECCLNPEITALAQKEYKESWSKSMPKPVRIMYAQKCYRYDRPQAGRYREFNQFGIELLCDKPNEYEKEGKDLLNLCILNAGLLKSATFVDSVKRGLGYYTKDGFEVECENLGAQKQIAGGGIYDCGIGWAIGVDRMILARDHGATK